MNHLDETGETYLEHMGHAMQISFLLLSSGIKCLIHAFIPSLYVAGVSSKLDLINAKVKRKCSE
jgi:hypothetical protein